jgi:hypothetical protein
MEWTTEEHQSARIERARIVTEALAKEITEQWPKDQPDRGALPHRRTEVGGGFLLDRPGIHERQKLERRD